MPLLPKQGYSATIGDAPIVSGRRATAQDFGAPGLGETGLVEAGHRVTATAKAYLSEVEEREARTALVQTTEIRAEYARRLDQAALDGSDLGKLKEEMEAAIAKVGEQFATTRGAEQLRLYAANSAIMYDQQANAINVQRAWSDARVQGQKFVNSASALIQSNPAYLAVAEKDAADFVATFPGIRPDQKAELTERLTKDLNMASAMSAARMDPDGTKKRLEGGEWDLSPEQRNTALHAADSYGNVKRAADERERVRIERERADAANLSRDKYTQQILQGNHGKALYDQIVSDPAFAHYPQYREHLAVFLREDAKRLANQERKSDERTKRDLWMAINAPEGDPRKIYTADKVFKAVEAGLLNTTDANQLNALVAGQKDENGRAFQSRLRERAIIIGRALNDSPEYKNQPDLAAAIQMRLVNEAERKSNDLRKQGKSPDSLLDETSSDYLFKPGMIRDAAAAVKRQQIEAASAGAVRVTSLAEMLAQPDGTVMIDPQGKLATMSPALRKKLGGTAAPALNRAAGVIQQ